MLRKYQRTRLILPRLPNFVSVLGFEVLDKAKIRTREDERRKTCMQDSDEEMANKQSPLLWSALLWPGISNTLM